MHPRSYGTFPRVLGHYSRDLKLFPLEEAVRKMTSLPAAQFGFADRGRIASGMAGSSRPLTGIANGPLSVAARKRHRANRDTGAESFAGIRNLP